MAQRPGIRRKANAGGVSEGVKDAFGLARCSCASRDRLSSFQAPRARLRHSGIEDGGVTIHNAPVGSSYLDIGPI